jgi:hypothetical protein
MAGREDFHSVIDADSVTNRHVSVKRNLDPSNEGVGTDLEEMAIARGKSGFRKERRGVNPRPAQKKPTLLPGLVHQLGGLVETLEPGLQPPAAEEGETIS